MAMWLVAEKDKWWRSWELFHKQQLTGWPQLAHDALGSMNRNGRRKADASPIAGHGRDRRAVRRLCEAAAELDRTSRGELPPRPKTFIRSALADPGVCPSIQRVLRHAGGVVLDALGCQIRCRNSEGITGLGAVCGIRFCALPRSYQKRCFNPCSGSLRIRIARGRLSTFPSRHCCSQGPGRCCPCNRFERLQQSAGSPTPVSAHLQCRARAAKHFSTVALHLWP